MNIEVADRKILDMIKDLARQNIQCFDEAPELVRDELTSLFMQGWQADDALCDLSAKQEIADVFAAKAGDARDIARARLCKTVERHAESSAAHWVDARLLEIGADVRYFADQDRKASNSCALDNAIGDLGRVFKRFGIKHG